MAWDLRRNMGDEISRVLSTEKVSVDEVEELYPPYPKNHHTIVGDTGTVAGNMFTQSGPSNELARSAVASLKTAQRGADALPALLGMGEGIGSNSWVVSGRRTTTGGPILPNNPPPA